MESYNNYQDIINAIKAEYVIVRDLKRVANAKKRELNNAHSFVNRKGNEETTLETRVADSKQAAFNRANTSLSTIESAIDSDYTLDLNASAAKLALIEADISKLQIFHNSLPEQFDGFTQNELNSINSLKGVLLSAINDTKFIYENDIIESSKFSALKDETKLSTETSSDNDITNHYNTIVYNVKQLIDSTRQHFADYVSTSSDKEEELRMTKDTLVNRTRELVVLKSDLADLLDSNATQTQIDSKNVQIDAQKVAIIEKANDLKRLDIETELFYTQKHKDFSVYFEVIHSLYEEVEDWLSDAKANSFVRYNLMDHGRDIQMYVRRFMEELITAIGEKIPTANGQSLSQIIGQVFASVAYDTRNGDQAFVSGYSKNRVLAQLDNYTNYDSSTGEFTLSTEVPGEVWSDSFYHLKQLHQRFLDYIEAKKHLEVKTSTFMSRFSIFNDGFTESFITYIPAFAVAYDSHKFREFELVSKLEGIWTGTPEQETTYQTLIDQRKTISTDLVADEYQKDLCALKLSLFSGMFPSFYSEEISLKSAKESTLAIYDGYTPQYVTLNDELGVANALVDTLTAGTPEYDAAIADRDAKDVALQAFKDDVYTPARDAKDNAIAAYDYHISTQNVYDLVSSFSPNGLGLMDIKLEAEMSVTQYEVSQSQLSENYTSLQAIKGEMTFVESDLATKLEAYGYIDDENTKAYKASQYWTYFIYSKITSLTQLSNLIIQSYNQIVDHQSNEESALQYLKDFTAPEYSANKDIERFGERTLFRAEQNEKFSDRVLTNMFNLDQYDLDTYFRPDSSTTMAFVNTPTFLSGKLKSVAQSYRGRATANFADQVIEFVNTGVSNF